MLNVCKLFMGELIFILSNVYLVYVQLINIHFFLDTVVFYPTYFLNHNILKIHFFLSTVVLYPTYFLNLINRWK